MEEVRSRVFLRWRRTVDRPDPSGGIVRVEGDAGDIFHELRSSWYREDWWALGGNAGKDDDEGNAFGLELACWFVNLGRVHKQIGNMKAIR